MPSNQTTARNRPEIVRRKLHLVDIENAIGAPRPSRSQVAAFKVTYAALGLLADDDLVVIACNHGAGIAVITGFAPPRLKLASGPDGADLALLRVLRDEPVEDRFTSVVLCSGDGIFAGEIARLGTVGVRTTVVSRRDSLSSRLAVAATRVVYLPADPEPTASSAPAVAA